MIGRGVLFAALLLAALFLLAHAVGTTGAGFLVGFVLLDLLALYGGIAIAADSWRPWR